jgi:hypothetical protein
MIQRDCLANAHNVFVNSGGNFHLYVEEIQGYMYALKR